MTPLGTLIQIGRILRSATVVVACALWASLGLAKATIVTLPELIKQSQLIVYGHVDTSARTPPSEPVTLVRFEASQVLDGSWLLLQR
jgi:hypothetical protein